MNDFGKLFYDKCGCLSYLFLKEGEDGGFFKIIIFDENADCCDDDNENDVLQYFHNFFCFVKI